MGTVPTEQFNLRKHSQAAQGFETSEDSRRQGRQMGVVDEPLRSSEERRPATGEKNTQPYRR